MPGARAEHVGSGGGAGDQGRLPELPGRADVTGREHIGGRRARRVIIVGALTVAPAGEDKRTGAGAAVAGTGEGSGAAVAGAGELTGVAPAGGGGGWSRRLRRRRHRAG